MTTTQEALSATLIDRADQAHTADTHGHLRDSMRRLLLRYFGSLVEEAHDDRPLMLAASRCPVADGHLLLGPEAIAVLDGFLEGTVDSMTFFEGLTAAIEADLDPVSEADMRAGR